jgi:hypothetical protein
MTPEREGVVTEIFETPWDTKNQGINNTRTVARVEYSTEKTFEHVFLDQLVVGK